MSAADLLDFSPEVAEALSAKKPIVALESTIITHGMPYPRNVETALSVEDAAREMGAVPATIAVIEGRFRVGLGQQEIEQLGELTGGVVKASRRDLAPVAARKGSAGTTVAATMFIASLAGLEIFATGGIGGVHRGAEETFDISADLVELRAPASPSSAPAPSRSSTSARRSNFWRRRGWRSSAIAATSSPPSTPARPDSSSSTAATGCTISPA